MMLHTFHHQIVEQLHIYVCMQVIFYVSMQVCMHFCINHLKMNMVLFQFNLI